MLSLSGIIYQHHRIKMAGRNSIRKNIGVAEHWLWQTDLQSVPVWQRIALKALRICYAVVRDLRDGQLSLRAMSLVYTTVIAIVPLLALCFSVLKGFGLHSQVEPALLDTLKDLGDKRFEIVANVMGFIDNIKVGVLGAVGFALLIYSVISMMHKIERSFNYTWQIKRDRTMSQRFRDYLSVIFVGPLMIFLSAAITTSVNTDTAMTLIETLPFGASFVSVFSTIIPYLIMSCGFAFIYMFLPNTQVNLGAAFVGGSVTAITWKIMGWGVATFIANSATNLAIYSAFASVIILMVWMYVGWLVLLVGASVSFYYQNPQYIQVRGDAMNLRGENHEQLAVSVLYLICQHYQRGLPPWTADSLGHRLQVAPHMVDDMIEFLSCQQYIVRAGEQNNLLYPNKPVEQIVIKQLFRDIRQFQISTTLASRLTLEQPVSQLFSDYRAAIDRQFGEQTIKDLLDNEIRTSNSVDCTQQ
ncbi:MAG: membrane protein [Gammaproteobacteria bacterium]|jgi:membrane protein